MNTFRQSVEIELPSDLEEQIMAGLKPIIDRALSIVDEVEDILKQVAIKEGKDINGEQIAPKKPKPTKTPKNHPNEPLVGKDGEHDVPMMDHSRFSTARTGDYEATLTYDPPDYFQYVIQKRACWTPDQINDDARARIEKRMVEAVEDI